DTRTGCDGARKAEDETSLINDRGPEITSNRIDLHCSDSGFKDSCGAGETSDQTQAVGSGGGDREIFLQDQSGSDNVVGAVVSQEGIVQVGIESKRSGEPILKVERIGPIGVANNQLAKDDGHVECDNLGTNQVADEPRTRIDAKRDGPREPVVRVEIRKAPRS